MNMESHGPDNRMPTPREREVRNVIDEAMNRKPNAELDAATAKKGPEIDISMKGFKRQEEPIVKDDPNQEIANRDRDVAKTIDAAMNREPNAKLDAEIAEAKLEQVIEYYNSGKPVKIRTKDGQMTTGEIIDSMSFNKPGTVDLVYKNGDEVVVETQSIDAFLAEQAPLKVEKPMTAEVKNLENGFAEVTKEGETPKSVETTAETTPEMSAKEIVAEAMEKLKNGQEQIVNKLKKGLKGLTGSWKDYFKTVSENPISETQAEREFFGEFEADKPEASPTLEAKEKPMFVMEHSPEDVVTDILYNVTEHIGNHEVLDFVNDVSNNLKAIKDGTFAKERRVNWQTAERPAIAMPELYAEDVALELHKRERPKINLPELTASEIAMEAERTKLENAQLTLELAVAASGDRLHEVWSGNNYDAFSNKLVIRAKAGTQGAQEKKESARKDKIVLLVEVAQELKIASTLDEQKITTRLEGIKKTMKELMTPAELKEMNPFLDSFETFVKLRFAQEELTQVMEEEEWENPESERIQDVRNPFDQFDLVIKDKGNEYAIVFTGKDGDEWNVNAGAISIKSTEAARHVWDEINHLPKNTSQQEMKKILTQLRDNTENRIKIPA